jgi:fused signal recognition particle receptor
MNLESITSAPIYTKLVEVVDGDLTLFIVGISALYFATALFAIREQFKSRMATEQVVDLQRKVQALELEIASLRAVVSAEAQVPTTGAVSLGSEPQIEPKTAVAEELPAVAPLEEIGVVERSSITRGMSKSRSSFLGKLKNLFGGKQTVDLSIIDDLEEALITSDVGAKTTDALLAAVRQEAADSKEISEDTLRKLLKEGVRSELIEVSGTHRLYAPVDSPLVVLVVGVNGVGKTTTVAKLATRYQSQGKKVLAVAADTFRAAAVQQLQEWGSRKNFEVYAGAENAKPAAVVFDGMVAAKERGVDVVLIDTAGRLHTKSNLMQELEGVRNSIRRHIAEAPHETVLVVDGVSGQNALMQARDFNASTPLTGLVVTKLDGTPKGGIIVAISQELKIPVMYVGVGEKAEDLLPFSADEFVEGLFTEEGDSATAQGVPANGGFSHGASYHSKANTKI